MLFRQFAPLHELSRGRMMLNSCHSAVTKSRVSLAVRDCVHIKNCEDTKHMVTESINHIIDVNPYLTL